MWCDIILFIRIRSLYSFTVITSPRKKLELNTNWERSTLHGLAVEHWVYLVLHCCQKLYIFSPSASWTHLFLKRTLQRFLHFRRKFHTHNIFTYVTIHIFTCIKPNTVRRNAGWAVSNNIMEAYLCLCIEEMLIWFFIDWFLEKHFLKHKKYS